MSISDDEDWGWEGKPNVPDTLATRAMRFRRIAKLMLGLYGFFIVAIPVALFFTSLALSTRGVWAILFDLDFLVLFGQLFLFGALWTLVVLLSIKQSSIAPAVGIGVGSLDIAVSAIAFVTEVLARGWSALLTVGLLNTIRLLAIVQFLYDANQLRTAERVGAIPSKKPSGMA